MKVFVTGATGFVTGTVTMHLLARGDQVRALVRDASRGRTLARAGVTAVAGDLSDAGALRRGMEGVDAVVHGAAIYEVGIPPLRRPAMYEANVIGTERVLEAALAAGVRRIAYVSTVAIFGNTRGAIVDETYTRSGPYTSYYEETKVRAHEIALRLAERGLPVSIAQPGGVYGPGDSSGMGGLMRTTSYVLDGNGNATTRTTADGVSTTYVYDEMSRLKTVSSSGLPVPIGYDYDELSHRKTMTDGTGTSTYTYDGLGRLTQAVQPNGTLGYGYDLDSNRSTLTYPAVGSVTYVFSPAGRLSSLTDWGSRQSTYTYTAAGLAKTVVVPGGMTTTYTYDNAQRLTALLNATGAATISSHTYTLDNEGNRTAIDEIMNGIFASAKINSDTGTAVQDHPDIAIGADSGSYLIWDDARDGNANIYFSRRDAATDTWSTNVKVNTDTGTRIQLNPAIAIDSSNNAYAVWQDERNGANKADIYFSKRSAAGTWTTPNAKVSDDPGANGGAVQRNPRIAGTAAGVETAVWVDLRSSQNNIYSSQLPAGGTTWPANKKITDNTAALKDFPDVAVDSANTAYAVWQDSRNGNADIFFSTLTNGGAAWAANVKISDDPGTAAQTKPRMGIDGAGNVIVAWIDARTSPARVRAARKPFGGAWSASVEVSLSPANAQSLALSVRSDGYAWATWGDTRAGASNSDIWGSRYDPYLISWSPPQRVDDATGTTAQLSPTVASTATETMLGWRDNRLNNNGDTQARRVVFLPGLTDHFALTYDGLNRLTSVKGPVSETFTLDQASNVSNRSGTIETYDTANRLTQDGSTVITWWDADRLKTRGTDAFNYDALDRLQDATVSGAARTYAYNGDGLLQTRTGNGAAALLWDPSSSTSQLLTQGNDKIVYGLGPLYMVKSDTSTLTFARDGSKNVRAETSGTGAILGSFRYRSYGQVAQATSVAPSVFGAASQLVDPSGLSYMRARWQDPSTGRFLSRDPADGSPDRPMTLNAYVYAGANPTRMSDPTGRAFVADPTGSGCDPNACNKTPQAAQSTPLPTAGAQPVPVTGAPTPVAQAGTQSRTDACQQPDALTVGVGLVTSTVVFAAGVAFIAGGVALAGAGIAEAGATGGAGVLVTVWALHEGAELAMVGTVLIASSALVANESWVRAIRCGGVR